MEEKRNTSQQNILFRRFSSQSLAAHLHEDEEEEEGLGEAGGVLRRLAAGRGHSSCGCLRDGSTALPPEGFSMGTILT